MSFQPVTGFYIPSEATVQSPLYAFPGEKHESPQVTRSSYSRKRSHDVENIHRNNGAFTTSVKKDRKKTTDYRQARPVTPRNDVTRVARILPQRIISPRSTTGVQSIWFRSESEYLGFGVSLADIVDHGAEGLMVASEERVFRALGLDYDEIQFSILWPGYGHVSWIASIPINICDRRGHQHGFMTRRLLALAIAHHFRAFMTNHSYLRFPHPDPTWKIMNDRENGIRFENLRLTRLFSYKDETGRLGSWQAEILVVGGLSTHTHRCIP